MSKVIYPGILRKTPGCQAAFYPDTSRRRELPKGVPGDSGPLVPLLRGIQASTPGRTGLATEVVRPVIVRIRPRLSGKTFSLGTISPAVLLHWLPYG